MRAQALASRTQARLVAARGIARLRGAAAYTKLAQAASAPSESEARRELTGRAAALVEADDPTVRDLAIGVT